MEYEIFVMPKTDSRLLREALKDAHRKAKGRLRKMLKRAIEILEE